MKLEQFCLECESFPCKMQCAHYTWARSLPVWTSSAACAAICHIRKNVGQYPPPPFPVLPDTPPYRRLSQLSGSPINIAFRASVLPSLHPDSVTGPRPRIALSHWSDRQIHHSSWPSASVDPFLRSISFGQSVNSTSVPPPTSVRRSVRRSVRHILWVSPPPDLNPFSLSVDRLFPLVVQVVASVGSFGRQHRSVLSIGRSVRSVHGPQPGSFTGRSAAMPLDATANAALPAPRACTRARTTLPVPLRPSATTARRCARCTRRRAPPLASQTQRWSTLRCETSASARNSHTLDWPHPSLPTIYFRNGVCVGQFRRVSVPGLSAT